MALSGDGWVRRFLVTDPQRHRKGFTVYKVTSIVYPTTSPEATTKVVVWKRYNDFKKLHRELQQRHQKLYLKDTFPPFCKSTLFGRFEEEVVEERRLCALRLLEFAAENPSLFTSQIFVKFFESGYSMGNTSNNSQQSAMPFIDDSEFFGDAILPEPLLRPLKQAPRLVSAESLDPDPLTQGEQFAIGSWPGSDGCEDDGGHTSDSDTPPASPQLTQPSRTEGEELLQFFDPLCGDMTIPSQDLLTEPTNAQLMASLNSNSQQDLLQLTVDDNASFSGPRGSTDSCHGAGYLFEAACQVSRAQQYEANCHYEEAFATYKTGIAILLGGVQGDDDATRRQIVKDKTAKYLIKAERLYNTYLAPLSDNTSNWIGSLIRPAADLANYKVLGILGRSMIVTDVSNMKDSQDCYFLKAVYKSPCPVQNSAGLVIPKDVPFMVPLFRYHETDNAYFMVLQHVSGGKLWDHLGAYINASTSTDDRSQHVSQHNTYLGQKLLPEIDSNNANSTLDDNCKPDEDLPPLAQDVTDDLNMNRTEGSVSIVTDENGSNHARFSWAGLDTAELLQNAQKLLQSVSATLQKSENVIARSEKPSMVQYVSPDSSKGAIAKCFSEEKEEGRGEHRRSSNSARSKSSTGHLAHSRARLIERRYSCDDLFDGRGSLESGSSRRGYRGSASLGIGARPRLPEATVKIWASQLVVALEALHAYGLLFRDLRPDNVLLGTGGCAVLTFTAQWPSVDVVIETDATVNLYAAPEATGVVPPTSACDWWSLGALLYELIIGKTLVSCHPGGIHSHTILHLPDWVSSEARSLLNELLKPDPYERLGSGSHGLENLKSHPFFKGVHWSTVRAAGLPTPKE